MRRACRSSSFMSGKLALEPLRVRWARLGRTSFAPLGGWAGSRPSSVTHAALCGARGGRRHATPHSSACSRSRSRSCRIYGEHGARAARPRGAARRARPFRSPASLIATPPPRLVWPSVTFSRAPLCAPSRAHACTRTRTARHVRRLQRSRLGAPRATLLSSVARARGRRLRPRPDGRCSAGAAPSRVDKSLDLSLPKGSGSRRAPLHCRAVLQVSGPKACRFQASPPPPFRVPLWS
jgi:hypothetical protein